MKSALLFGLIATLAGPALAQTSEDLFFKGKTITIAVGAPPGGTLDPYARLMQKFLGARIPGNPNIVVTNVPGASEPPGYSGRPGRARPGNPAGRRRSPWAQAPC